MKSEVARTILAIQAVEQADEDDAVLSDADRREASASAGAPLPKNPDSGTAARFFAERADLLRVRVSTRHPNESGWLREEGREHRLGLVAAGLLVVAAVAGFFSNELGPENRINLLSFPLLGILAWSLLVYLRELFLLFRRTENTGRGGWSEGVLRWLRSSGNNESRTRAEDAEEDPAARILHSARDLFQKRWWRLTVPVGYARLKSLLHLVALVLALGAVGGMYLQGLANEYRAVWESTFFTDSSALRPFLQAVLGPAASLTGDAIPSVEELEALHWQAGENEVAGENAARWIHWYAITIGLFVGLPRLLLALVWKWRAGHAERSLPWREIHPGYYDHLLAVSSGRAREFHLLPYGLEVDGSRHRLVERALENHLKSPVELRLLEPVPFGEEEEPPLDVEPEANLVPLLNFSATPERETHFALVDSIEKTRERAFPFLLLDATEFDRRSRSFPDAGKRRSDRESAWRRLFEGDSNRELVIVSALEPSGATTEPSKEAGA